MSRTIRAFVAVVLVAVITFSAISICQNIGRTLRLDITDEGLYTLSAGSRAILGKLNKPLKFKLFYTRTAARKAPDQIRFYNNYYYFVESLLEEYTKAAKGMIDLEVIDPRPYSNEEEDALRYGLKRFPISAEENFFFGLVLQTEYGVVKSIPFFSPDRQNFVEYDISHLIDIAITPEKKRIGVLSSLPVTGEDVSNYMAQLRRMQGQPTQPPWAVVQHLRQKYQVTKVETDVEDINDVDILLVIHPKELVEKVLFAIDQFVLKGGRAIICVDPRCFIDSSRDPMTGRQMSDPVSDLNQLLRTWGVEMPAHTFAGDRSLAMFAQMQRNERLEKLIGYLNLTRECVNTENVITANLNQVRLVFPGVLQKVTNLNSEAGANELIPLLQTTDRGNTWQVEGPWDWIRIVPGKFMSYFTDGTEPVVMSYLVKGRFKSSFPDGIEISDDTDKADKDDDADEEGEEKPEGPKRLTGLTEAETDCAVLVIADVDFISDEFAYQNTIFGLKIAVGNNSDFLLNAIDDLGGSGDLIGIRSRGNFQRPFEVVKQIKSRAEQETAKEVAQLNAEKERLEKELLEVASSAKKGQESIIAASWAQKQRELEIQIHNTDRQLRDVRLRERQDIERLGGMLQNLNTWAASAVVLLIAIVMSIRRSVMRRRYVSHASDV